VTLKPGSAVTQGN